MECWFDAGISPMHKQMKRKAPPKGWVPMEIHVEDGISLLSSMIHQRRQAVSPEWYLDRPLTAVQTSRHAPATFQTDVFTIAADGKSKFVIAHLDFEATWDEHIGYGGYQNRPMKGKEWGRAMIASIDSLMR
jgi:hypothetical protein